MNKAERIKGFKPFSQCSPLNPGMQTQMFPFPLEKHVPPFSHTLTEHSGRPEITSTHLLVHGHIYYGQINYEAIKVIPLVVNLEIVILEITYPTLYNISKIIYDIMSKKNKIYYVKLYLAYPAYHGSQQCSWILSKPLVFLW